MHIAQFAREIAGDAAVADHIEASDGGIGFVCVAPAVGQAKALPVFARAVLTLLHALSAAPPAANGLTARGWPMSWRRCSMAMAARPHA